MVFSDFDEVRLAALAGTGPDPITGASLAPGGPVLPALVKNLAAFLEDETAGMQRLVAQIPHYLAVDRAYIARLSADGVRFTVTAASASESGELLGYTQSVARLPAFVRGSLQSGIAGAIEDVAKFPLTPQQRKMPWYEQARATVVTPIPLGGVCGGALVVDSFRPRKWEPALRDTLKAVARAVGTRINLARSGDHLSADRPAALEEGSRLHFLATVADLLERTNDPAEVGVAVAAGLANLPFVDAARYLDRKAGTTLHLEAQAGERLIVRRENDPAGGAVTVAVLPLVLDGERFGAIELTLVERRLGAADEQFLRIVETFSATAYASALRRKSARNESMVDSTTGLPSYRAIHELLGEAVYQSKMQSRPCAVWMLDLDSLAETNQMHGYAIGDDCLGYLGRSLGDAVTGRGAAGRVRGATFLAVFPGMPADEARVAGSIFVERIARQSPGHLPKLVMSVGVAAFPTQGLNAEDVVRNARLAMFVAKRPGTTRVEIALPQDERWRRDALSALVRTVTEQETPSMYRH